jgi:HlyD family secretion protein
MRPLLALVLVALAAGGFFAWRARASSGDSAARIEGKAVVRGPLAIDVVERGNLKAEHSVDLKCEVEGQTTILSLIKEGTLVEPGMLLCELDTANLLERRVSQEIVVQNADANHVNATQAFEIQKSENESQTSAAERQLAFARLDLRKYLEGDFPLAQRAAEEEILIADEELERAKQEHEWSQKLFEKGFLEATQLAADRLAEQRSSIQLDQKKRELELLEQFDYPRKQAELAADVAEAERELDRTRLQCAARIVDFESDLSSAKAKLELEREKLIKIVSQIQKASIVAPVRGMVVYAQEEQNRWGGGQPIREGTGVRERQTIITIPSADGMIAQASLHESVLQKVDVGMPCTISVDAVTDRQFHGTVRFKAVLPDQNAWWANPDLRLYRTEVSIEEPDERLRPGMSCSVEILAEEIPDALQIPVQSVFLDSGKTVCFVSQAGEVAVRPIEVGPNNGKMVQIQQGLSVGEIVLLAQPAGFQLKPAVESTEPEALEPPLDGPPGGERTAESERSGAFGSEGEAFQGERGARASGAENGTPGGGESRRGPGGERAGRGERGRPTEDELRRYRESAERGESPSGGEKGATDERPRDGRGTDSSGHEGSGSESNGGGK